MCDVCDYWLIIIVIITIIIDNRDYNYNAIIRHGKGPWAGLLSSIIQDLRARRGVSWISSRALCWPLCGDMSYRCLSVRKQPCRNSESRVGCLVSFVPSRPALVSPLISARLYSWMCFPRHDFSFAPSLCPVLFCRAPNKDPYTVIAYMVVAYIVMADT